MNTKKMIADIRITIEALESEKNDLLAHVKAIDDDLTAYRMAVDALELTRQQVTKIVKEAKEKTESASPQKQRQHKRMIEYKGKNQSISAWAREVGISPKLLSYRINSGWPINEALRPIGQYNRKKEHQKIRKVFSYDGHGNVLRQYNGIGDASRDLNLPKETIEKILNNVPKDDQLRARNYYLAYAS